MRQVDRENLLYCANRPPRAKRPWRPSFSCLWLVLWSKARAKIQTIKNSCEKQRKHPLFTRKVGVLWSCWADSNRRPHPYQLIGRVRFPAFGCFYAFSSPKDHTLWHTFVHWFRCLVFPCGSRCGSTPAMRQRMDEPQTRVCQGAAPCPAHR